MTHRPRDIAAWLPFYYGWVMLVIAIVAAIACYPGQTVALSVFNDPFRKDLGLSHSELSGAYMLATILAGLSSVVAGAAMDRFGIRRTIFALSLMMGAACMATAAVWGLGSLFVAFLLLRVIGHGSLPLVADNTVAMWFHKRLGLAMGIKNLAGAVAVGAVPALNLWLIHLVGWRRAFVVLGACIWSVVLPAVAFLFRNRPEDIGQFPDGEVAQPHDATVIQTTPAQGVAGPASGGGAGTTSFSLFAAVRTRSYWIVLLFGAVCGMFWAGITFNIVPLFEGHGLSKTDAAAAIAVCAASLALVQLLGGLLADRVPLNLLLCVAAATAAAAVAMLTQVHSFAMAAVFAVAIGAGSGLGIVAGGTLWPRYFGRTHLGKIRGTAMMATVLGSAIGPFLLGAAHDAFGTFDSALWFLSGACGVLAVALCWATPPGVAPRRARRHADAERS